MKKLLISIFLLSTQLFLPRIVSAQEHPFMLVRSNMYDNLRSLTSQSPWNQMKASAINECNNLSFPCLGSDTFCMRAIVSSCALAYITDPSNKNTYVNKVRNSIPYWEDILVVQSGFDDGVRNTSNEYYTDATSAYFNSILAIDVMHDDLHNAQPVYRNLNPDPWPTPRNYPNALVQAEDLMQQEFNHFYGYTMPVFESMQYHMPSRHPPAQEAALIMWLIYKGEFSQADSDSRALIFGGMLNNGYPDLDGDGKNIEGFISEIGARINESGVYTEGSSYAYAGWGLDRDERSHLVDVLEFTGKDSEFGLDFYTNHRYQNFYEWLYGYASTPFGVMTSFGDTYAFRQLSDNGHAGNSWAESSHIGQARKFGTLAGDYAIWKSDGHVPQGRLLQYLLRSSAGSSSRPSSRIFENGGGFFMEDDANENSLYGVLWNVREPIDGSPVFHVRKDVNAIYVAGYGEPFLMNGGFCGSSSPAGPDSCSGRDETGTQTRFTGTYLGDRAVSNNVGMVNYTIGNNLDPNPDGTTGKFGSGVTQGFLGNGFDYVSASTRYGTYNALSDGVHDRTFAFVKPDSGTNGYFVSFDEFSEVSNGPVHLVFHPNSNGREVIENLTIYDLPIGQKVSGNVSAGVRLFFATSPQSIQFERGIIATASSVGAWVPEYFFNTYQISTGGKKMVTVIFPYDASHNKATMQKISGSNYTGGQVIQGNTTDTLIEKTGSGNAIVESASFDGKFLFFRNTSGNLNSYFAKEAKSLTFSGNQYGINSQNNVTVQMKDRLGKIVTSGGEVTFYYPGITSVFVDNQAATTIQSGNGFRTVNITSGTHDIEIVNDGSTPNPSIPGDVNGDRVINIQDYLLLSNSFGKFSGQTGFNPGADFNGDNVVNIQDYQILSSNFGRSN